MTGTYLEMDESLHSFLRRNGDGILDGARWGKGNIGVWCTDWICRKKKTKKEIVMRERDKEKKRWRRRR